MKSTIILSMARSGTTFLNTKLLGMLGFDNKIYHHFNEIAFEGFYVKHKIEYLIESPYKYDGKGLREFNPKIHFKLHDPRKYSNECYYSTNQSTLETIIEKCTLPVFNVHIFQINENYNLIKKIKSPILFLIRKNNWQRMVSQYLFNKRIIPPHMQGGKGIGRRFKGKVIPKKIDIEIAKSDLDQMIIDSDYQVNLIKTFQKELKDQKNVKFVYYEDIENKAFWTNEFINQLEDFTPIKFTNRNYEPSFTKTRDSVNLVNREEVMNQDLIKKYYIKEI